MFDARLGIVVSSSFRRAAIPKRRHFHFPGIVASES